MMNLQNIGDCWKAHRKIYQMSPSASIYINLLKRYKQNKGIYAVLEKIQQPVPVGSLWPLIIWLYMMLLQKIGDSWKAHRKIYQMSPYASNFINWLKRI